MLQQPPQHSTRHLDACLLSTHYELYFLRTHVRKHQGVCAIIVAPRMTTSWCAPQEEMVTDSIARELESKKRRELEETRGEDSTTKELSSVCRSSTTCALGCRALFFERGRFSVIVRPRRAVSAASPSTGCCLELVLFFEIDTFGVNAPKYVQNRFRSRNSVKNAMIWSCGLRFAVFVKLEKVPNCSK